MKKTGNFIGHRDITKLLELSGVPKEKMSFIFQTPYGNVFIKYGCIVSNNQKANAYLTQTLKKPGVKIKSEAFEEKKVGLMNSFLKKK